MDISFDMIGSAKNTSRQQLLSVLVFFLLSVLFITNFSGHAEVNTIKEATSHFTCKPKKKEKEKRKHIKL